MCVSVCLSVIVCVCVCVCVGGGVCSRGGMLRVYRGGLEFEMEFCWWDKEKFGCTRLGLE